MAKELKGLLVDYEFCSGCHACEVACKKSHGLGAGQYGVLVTKFGPFQKPDGRWEMDFVPHFGELCDRVASGRKPSCVHHCQSFAIQYGTVAELAEKIDKTKMALFVPQGQ